MTSNDEEPTTAESLGQSDNQKTLSKTLAWLRVELQRGAQWVRMHAPHALAPRGLLRIGVDWRSLLAAFVATILTFALINSFLIWRTDATYRSFVPQIVQQDSTPSDLAQQYVEQGWASARLEPWLTEAVFVEAESQKIHDQIEAVFRQLAASEEYDKRRAQILKQMITGNRRGWFLVSTKSTNGREVLKALVSEEVDKGVWLSMLEGESEGLANLKKDFVVRLSDQLIIGVQGPLRWLRRFNGAIQWLTVILTYLILFVLLRRYFMLVKLRRHWLPVNGTTADTLEFQSISIGRNDDSPASYDWELRGIARRVEKLRDAGSSPLECQHVLDQETANLNDGIDKGVYDTLGFMVGVLPSLGFIGTVLGMGAALFNADLLFASTDRQLGISRMTQELGYAFDTTLVALIAGILTSVPLAALRVAERALFRDVTQRIAVGPAESRTPPLTNTSTSVAKVDIDE